MRKYILIFIQLFLAANLVVLGFTACTTSDDELEDESIEEELGEELGEIEAADPAASNNDESGSGGEEVSDADFEDDEGGGTDDEDEDFFAEDSDAPENTDDLAEKDLDKELGKDGAQTTAAAPAPPPPANEPAPIYPEAAPPVPAPGALDAAKTAGISSKESIPGADGFEFINPNESALPKEDLGVSDPLVTDVDPPLPSMKAAKDLVPVSKIGRDPFYRNERLMNTVFIARPGDDLATISQKVFGEDKTAILLSDNPHIGKGVEPGDKIYYTSPNRADDRKTILTYYEDNKMAPAYYETEAGDDIQKIGRKVLGYEEAWKEVWAVNDSLQTQAMLPAGLKLRYWSGNENKKGEADVASAATTAGYSEPPSPPSSSGGSTPLEDNNNLNAVATEKEGETPIELPATDSTPPPIADPSLAGGDLEAPPLLPDTASPAPSPDTVAAQSNGSLATIAGVAMVILAVMALIAIQIKNRKRPDDSIPPSLEFTKV